MGTRLSRLKGRAFQGGGGGGAETHNIIPESHDDSSPRKTLHVETQFDTSNYCKIFVGSSQ